MRHVFVASVLLAGCGLIDSDVARFNFALPSKTYSFNASMFNLPAGVSQEVPCGTDQIVADCCNPPAPAPMPDCTMTPLTCEPNSAGTAVCTAAATASVSQAVNLSAEVPDLPSSLVDLRVEAVNYEVPSNTLNVDVPPLALFLAPAGVMDPNDARAVKFGTLPVIPAMWTGSGSVMREPGANQTFASFAGDVSTPFTFIGTTTIKVPSGSPTPAGAIQIRVSGTLSAGL